MSELSVTEYIKKAFDVKSQGNYKQAIELFYKALSIDDESSEIMSEIANLYFKMNDPERAIEYYEQALEADPFNLNIKFELALVNKHLGNIQKAIDLIESVYLKNNDLKYLVELLHSLCLEGRNEEVVDKFEKSDFQNADSDALFNYVAMAYRAMGKNDEAEVFYRKAISLNNDNSDAKYSLAEILVEKKSYKEPEELLLSILEEKICSKTYHLLGQIHFNCGRYDKAINYFSIAANIESNNPQYFYDLGTSYSLKGFLAEAEDAYQKAVKLSPNNLHYNYTLAYLNYQSGEISNAKQKLEYVLSINPHHIDALVLKALIASEDGDVLAANKLLDEVLENTKTNDFAFYVKSLLFKKLNWWEKAIETIKKALELRPDSLEYMSELATYFYNAKLYDETKEICAKIISQDKKFLYAYLLGAKAYYVSLDYENALKYVEKALRLDQNSDEAYYIKALVFKDTAVINSAIEMAQIAINIAPQKIEYYEFIAKGYFAQQNYKDAYSYYKEASNLDMLNVSYKYQMAKCAQCDGNNQEALANYSVAKRLEPANVFIATQYADFLCSIHKVKKAYDMLKTTLDYNPSNHDRTELVKKILEVREILNDKSTAIERMFSKLKSKK
ncbi:MAG: tetratricopeptide repeat protein [Candidatus Gastranaerophilales bacterium]|nr:tetratricopeptide repeat protein [Candidatus Gastranaerophilales bacterium]